MPMVFSNWVSTQSEELSSLLGFIVSYSSMLLMLIMLGLFYSSENSLVEEVPLSNTQLVELGLLGFPILLLVLTAISSLYVLYHSNLWMTQTQLTLKVIGNQWYWGYELGGSGLEFQSFMLPPNELMPGMNRLLEVENRLVLPLETPILLVFTSLDVIHAWALPAYGLKVDCVAGLLNSQAVYFTHPGLYFGQCSEVCGVGHSFMPIVVEVVPYRFWLAWLLSL